MQELEKILEEILDELIQYCGLEELRRRLDELEEVRG